LQKRRKKLILQERAKPTEKENERIGKETLNMRLKDTVNK
jgi:hypothetical protein